MLYQHPAVHQAAVFAIPNRVMGELVGAAVTLRPEAAAAPPASRELIAWCQSRLAHYKVPSEVHIVPKMPTTGAAAGWRDWFGWEAGGRGSGTGDMTQGHHQDSMPRLCSCRLLTLLPSQPPFPCSQAPARY